MSAGAAAWWGALGASSLLLGSGLTLWLRPSDRVVGLTMGFGAGALISATSFELVVKAIHAHGPVVLGLTAGAVTFFAADVLIDRRGGADRKRIAEGPAPSGSGLAIFVGTLLDGIPESMVLGVTVGSGGAVSVSFLAAVFVSNLPEAIAATGGFRAAGRPPGALLTMLADSMMPEAFEHGGKAVGLLTVLGYIVATTLTRVG